MRTRILAGAAALVVAACSSGETGDPAQDAGDPAQDAGDPAQDAGDSAAPAAARHVLLIIADDMGIDATAAYADVDGDGLADDGRDYAQTPNITAICQEGVRFDAAWSWPVCSPTRASMLTGRYGLRTGVGAAVKADNELGPDELTLPKLLESVAPGFPKANIGKWHLGTRPAIGGKDAPGVAGWDHFAGILGGGLQSYSEWARVVDGVQATETGYSTTVMVDDAIAWLGERDATQPWLLWMAFNAPHAPFHLPPEGLHAHPDLSGADAHIASHKSDYYRAMVEAMDAEIGRLVGWMEANGHGPVEIVFVGDNGTPGGAVDAPLQGDRAKGTVYEGGVHVPLCIAGPAVVDGGRATRALVSTADLFATLLELAGGDWQSLAPTDRIVDSVSLLPLLADPAAPEPRDWLYTEMFGTDVDDVVAARDARFKLIRRDGGAEELYDLGADALETQELLAAGALTADAQASYDTLSANIEALSASQP